MSPLDRVIQPPATEDPNFWRSAIDELETLGILWEMSRSIPIL
jgi:hypothetical protein